MACTPVPSLVFCTCMIFAQFGLHFRIILLWLWGFTPYLIVGSAFWSKHYCCCLPSQDLHTNFHAISYIHSHFHLHIYQFTCEFTYAIHSSHFHSSSTLHIFLQPKLHFDLRNTLHMDLHIYLHMVSTLLLISLHKYFTYQFTQRR